MTHVKVIHVESGMHLYGGARQVLSLLDALRGSYVDSVLVCAAGSDLEREARARGIEGIRALPMAGDLDPLLWWRLLRIIRDEMPAVVHLHSRRGADVQGGIAARLAGVRTVLSRRVDHPPSRVLLEHRYRLYDRVIAISAEIRRVLADAGVPARKLVCVPSAVEVERFDRPLSHVELCARLGLAPEAVVVGVVAQLIPRKGHRAL